MADPITPALTAEEWRPRPEFPAYVGSDDNGSEVIGVEDESERWDDGVVTIHNEYPIGRPHALAALCLYQQPFGFTREDVMLLRDLADAYEEEARVSDLRADAGEQLGDSGFWGINARACGKRGASCASLASRIEALLPPESPDGD